MDDKIDCHTFAKKVTRSLEASPLLRAGLIYATAFGLEMCRAGHRKVRGGEEFAIYVLSLADQHVSAPNQLLKFEGANPTRTHFKELLVKHYGPYKCPEP